MSRVCKCGCGKSIKHKHPIQIKIPKSTWAGGIYWMGSYEEYKIIDN